MVGFWISDIPYCQKIIFHEVVSHVYLEKFGSAVEGIVVVMFVLVFFQTPMKTLLVYNVKIKA